MNKLVMAATATFIAISGASMASAQSGPGGFDFDAVDTNNDGQISREEMQAAREKRGENRAERFAAADANGDGALSKDEIKAQMTARAAERGKEINANRMERRLDRMFEKADANKDGKLTQEEMASMRGGKHGKKRQKQEG